MARRGEGEQSMLSGIGRVTVTERKDIYSTVTTERQSQTFAKL